MTSAPAAGWYPDPSNPQQMRWWNGTMWTAQVQAAPSAVGLMPPPQPRADALGRRRLPVWAWILIGIAAVILCLVLSPIFAPLWLVVLITGIVALSKNTPTWLRFRNRKVATVVTAVSAVMFLITGSLSSVVLGDRSGAAATSAASPSAPAATPAVTASASPSPTVTEKDEPVVAFSGVSSTIADTSATSDRTALEVLATLPVKGRAAKTGYSRDQFGQRWLDVDRNGCDTRNDILAAQLTKIVREGRCKVTSGILDDPFTGETITFVRGQGTSELVQIDHVVALSDSWQKGAQALTADQRATFANDPLNLLAVDGSANAQKGDGDAATWLPRNKAFRCEYVARQVAVKATYGLWVTQAEHDAIARVLERCPEQPAPTSTFATVAPEPAPIPVETAEAPAPAAPVPAAPAPAPPAPVPAAPAPAPAPVAPAAPSSTYYENCTAVRAAGAAPLLAGQPGYSRKLDRDGDGVACE